MSTERRFAAFAKKNVLPRMSDVPEGGLCLSAFIVLSKKGAPNEVLMGHLDPQGPWNHIGALDAARAERNSKGWMLPASHLLLEESPQDAAQRILSEQLGITDQQVTGPLVVSEAYSSNPVWNITPLKHWDLEFIFQGERESIQLTPAWRELKFIDLQTAKKEEIARSHEDILAHVGKWKS